LSVEDGILAALEGGAWRSGAEIAREAGVSRTAIWKKIEKLRRAGFAIEATAGRGYRLRSGPDLLAAGVLQPHLGSGRFGCEIVHRDEVDSTNRLASELARDGAPEGTVVIAESQTAGRGRLGRTWESPSHLNLYLSMVLRPGLAPVHITPIALVAAIGVVEAIRDTSGLGAAIKWPNDVLLSGRKVAGILTEMDAEADRVRFVVLGIGVNLNASSRDFPPELRRKASSLRIATRRRVDRVQFTAALIRALESRYDTFLAGGFRALRPVYESHHSLVGRRVRAEEGRISGTVLGVDDAGALLLDTPEGRRAVAAGEVSLHGSYRT
jgi:BirA family biotin operon repressor/biotin-[acetyl-CoA-carboxylase] ligase